MTRIKNTYLVVAYDQAKLDAAGDDSTRFFALCQSIGEIAKYEMALLHKTLEAIGIADYAFTGGDYFRDSAKRYYLVEAASADEAISIAKIKHA